MGICKCKRKTDLFCFVHKKAVCEECICTDHSTCFVKTYVDWLTDSEYETPSCGICKGDLVEGNVVRLMCLDLFHPECLDVHAASLPPHTAKAGYLCPTCSKPIFPPDATSNLAKQLSQHLSTANWAKTIMSGKNPEPVVLPSFDLTKKRKQADEASTIGAQEKLASDPSPASLTEIPLNNTSNSGSPNSPNPYAATTVSLTPVGSSSTQSPNLVRNNSTGLNDSSYGMSSRKANKEQSIYIDEQDDDDKYKKRSVRELFTAMGFVNAPSKEIKPTKTRQTRIKLDTKRLLIVFALLSCLATVIVMGISLSNDPAAQEVVEQ